MATIQSRLPTPSLKGVEKETTNSIVTSKLRKPTPVSISSTAPSSKQLQPTNQTQSTNQPQPEKQPQPTKQQKEKFPSETTPKSPQVEVSNKKPDFTLVKSRIGSLDIAKHKPKGGNIKIYIENSLENVTHTPKGGDKSETTPKSPQVEVSNKKSDFTHVKSRIGSLDIAKHKPKGGNVKIYTENSLENVTHTPKGGDKKAVSVKSDFSKVKSRVGSLENAKHVPKGGNVRIFSSKPDLKHVHSRVGSLDNIDYTPKGGDKIIFNDKLNFSSVKSRIGSLDNIDHVPKGGDIIIFDDKLNFSNVKSRVGSLDNIDHVPKGGDIIIFDDKLNLSDVKSRIGSLDNIDYIPKGGDVKIYDEKLRFKEYASPRIVSRSSTNSSNYSPTIADDDVSSLVNSPIPSLAFDDPFEVDPSQNEDVTSSPHTPTVEVLSPIMENFEEEEEIHEEEDFLLPVHMTETERSFEVHDSPLQQKQQRNANEKTNKHTEFSSKKETDSVYKDQECSGKETHYQQHEIVYEDYDSTSIRESTLYVTNNSLNDTDLSFEVNVLRKSTLLSSADRNSIASPEKLVSTVEVPPKIEHEFHKPELTIAQQRDYDESWI